MALFLPMALRQLERRDDEDKQRRTALDETRRLLYMAIACTDHLLAGTPVDVEIVASIGNSLTHHLTIATADEVNALVQALLVQHRGGSDLQAEARQQARAMIERICLELGDKRPVWPNP